MHFAGFIGIVGYPNAGKSSISNVLVGESLSVVNKKAQTTRHAIRGIVNGEQYQMILCDTPGVIDPAYKLQEAMMEAVRESLEESDAILLTWDVNSREDPSLLLSLLRNVKIPIVLVLNKIDLVSDQELNDLVLKWKQEMKFGAIIPVSAVRNQNFDVLRHELLKLLPEHPAYFPKDQLCDKSERFIVSEVVRGKALTLYRKEIPYSIEIVVQSFKEEEAIIRIEADLLVERNSQKGIIIGKGARDLKRLGMESRKELERFFDKKIYLNLSVKVRENWRNEDAWLEKLGYKRKG